jgi:hypothetical protein
MEYKGCIIVQGASYDFIIPKIREKWAGYQIIFSTWDDVDKSLYNESDIVIYSPKPADRGIVNFYLQKESTFAGLNKAEELGWSRVVKWRSDLVPKDGDSVYKLFGDGLNLYAWVNHSIGYITDYFMEGEIKDIRSIFDTNCEGFAEKMLTKRLFETELYNKVKYILKDVVGDSDIYFERKDFWLSDNINSSYFTNQTPGKWEEFEIPK